MTELLLPFQFAFMQKALLITMAVALPMAMLSAYVVLKGWSLMGDAIAHAVLPGVVLSYVAGIPLLIGAFVAGMICSVATGYLNLNSRVKEDTVMGVVFSGMFGLGLVLYAMVETSLHLDHILFGDMLGLAWGDVLQTGAIAATVTLLLLFAGRDLLAFAFDPAHARAIGLRTGLLHYGLLALISLTVVAALEAIGIILAIGMLIAPGAIAFLWTRRFGPMLLLAVLLAESATLAGITLSFWIDSAPAPTIVVLLTIAFIASFAATTLRNHRTERIG
ncbi:MAG: metal ABC transporter permease [Pseudomonadota bacterium]